MRTPFFVNDYNLYYGLRYLRDPQLERNVYRLQLHLPERRENHRP
ncbi:hypothetical protein QPK13_23570 [Photorhabdus tasmaniensis]